MSHDCYPDNLPAWCVENDDGHAAVLVPCECCQATTMTVDVDAARVHLHFDDVSSLERFRDCLSAAVEYQKRRATNTGEGEPDPSVPSLPRTWHGHAPDSLRESFLDWLDGWSTDEAGWDGRAAFVEVFLPTLSACTDPLPCAYCEDLDLPHGSTYGEAVEALGTRM